jgi:hypothetical protein
MSYNPSPLGKSLIAGTLFLLSACSPEPVAIKDEAENKNFASAPNATASAKTAAPEAAKVPAAAPVAAAQPVKAAANFVVDPACLDSVSWFGDDREAEDIKLTGCRPVTDIPTADEDGWRRFDSEGGERTMTRGGSVDPKTGMLSFEATYSGGGSLSGRYTVTGKPSPDGILKSGSYHIKPLN